MNKELMNEITSLEYKSLSEIESASFCKIWKWKSYLGKKGIIKTYFDKKRVEDEEKNVIWAMLSKLYAVSYVSL